METLKDIKYAITKNFSIKEMVCDGGTKILETYEPIFDATVVMKLKVAGAILEKQTNIDELGVQDTKLDTALAVANEAVTFALSGDTDGAVRRSVLGDGAQHKIVGYKPTYGLISRFGLYPLASALDTVGIYAKTVADVALVADTIKGLDENDMNTWDSSEIELVNALNADATNKKLFYIKALENDGFEKILEEQGLAASETNIDSNLIKAISPICECIIDAEMTTTLANLTGIPFGKCGSGKNADEMMFNCRSEFALPVKRSLIGGCASLLKENIVQMYHNSLRLRGLLFEEFNKLFGQYDVLVSSNTDEVRKLANLCGFPSVALSNGLVLTGKQRDDAKVLNVAKMLEKAGE